MKNRLRYLATAYLSLAAVFFLTVVIQTVTNLKASAQLNKTNVLVSEIYVPPVGPGGCVGIPGPNGTMLPCSKSKSSAPATSTSQTQTPAPTSQVQSSAASAPQDVPCRDVSFSDNQKGACAKAVQRKCMRKYPNGGKTYAECVYNGITGTGVPAPSLYKATLPLPQAARKSSSASSSAASQSAKPNVHTAAPTTGSWDGAYPVNGTVTCTNLSTGKKATETTSDIFTVKNNVMTSGQMSAPIDAKGNAVLTSNGLRARVHFTRSDDNVFVNAQATGKLSVPDSNGNPVPVSCSTSVSGGWTPLSSAAPDSSAASSSASSRAPTPQPIQQQAPSSAPAPVQNRPQTQPSSARTRSTGGTWDGAYGMHGTITCSSDDGRSFSKDFSEGGNVVNNVLPTVAGGVIITTGGNASFAVQVVPGVSVTYSLHFTRSGNSLGVSGAISGGGAVTNEDGTVTSWKCSAPISGGAAAPTEPEGTSMQATPNVPAPSAPPTPSVPKTCVQPVYDCSKCQNLPSYPTYQKESCLTQCGNEYQKAQDAYNSCMGY